MGGHDKGIVGDTTKYDHVRLGNPTILRSVGGYHIFAHDYAGL